MTQSAIPLSTAKNLFDFGNYLKRKIILEMIMLILSIFLVVIVWIFVPDILDVIIITYPSDITPLFLGIVIPLIILSVILTGLGIASLIYTILMLISISRAKDTHPHPELNRTSLMLILGLVLKMIGFSVVGLIIELIGWDAFQKFLVNSQPEDAKNQKIEQNVRVYIITSAISIGVTTIVTMILLFPFLSTFFDIVMNSEWTDPETIITQILDVSSEILNKSLISSVIGIALGLLPLIFALKIANSMKILCDYAKSHSGIAQQSYYTQYIPNDQPKPSGPTIKFCQYCGNKIQVDSQFCKHCGQKLNY